MMPLTSQVKEILLKYKRIQPTSISNQKVNEYIKKLGQMTEINERKHVDQNSGA
jgi:hypothetical protein